jgi:hypothetical protein
MLSPEEGGGDWAIRFQVNRYELIMNEGMVLLTDLKL